MISRNNYGLDLFNDIFKDPFWNTFYTDGKDRPMKTDIYETPSMYLLEIELPGYSRDDIRAELENGYLTISASQPRRIEEGEEKMQLVRRERYQGSYKRSFYVGDDLQQEDIKASFKNGILKLTIPKEVQKKLKEKRFIAIE